MRDILPQRGCVMCHVTSLILGNKW